MRSLAVVFTLLASISAAMAAEMTYEEAVVRNTYAKLSYAVDLNTAYRIVQANPKIDPQDLARQVNLHALRFKLSDFKIGDLADVADAKYNDVFPQYDDEAEVIHTTVETDNYGETAGVLASMETATAKWGPRPEGNAPELTVKQLVPILEQEMGVSSLRLYCSFTVTATLAGRSRTYRASFLFGDEGQIAAVDAVAGTNGNNLEYFLLHPLYPSVLLATRMAEIPAVRNFLKANRRIGAACQPHDACCDAQTLQCGVFNADLEGKRP